MSNYYLVKADIDLFAVYQVVHSKTDIEMWYDWNARLKDTKFTDQCYWLMDGDRRVGGAIIDNDTVIYPFIIPPFSDRRRFWDILLSCCNKIKHINGVVDEDVNLLLSSGFKVNAVRQVMCCPADSYHKLELPPGFSIHVFDESTDIEVCSKVIAKGYAGGIDHEVYGVPSADEVVNDVNYLLQQVYKHQNLSVYIVDDIKQEMIALCIAGISENIPLGFAEIGEICVLPQYRNKGIAEFMLKSIIVNAAHYTPVIKLCITVGNPAERLYSKVGFQPGPKFARMSKRTIAL